MATIPMTGVQILYPITTTIYNDKSIVELENGQFAVTQINSTAKRMEVTTLNVKILRSQFATFYNFVRSNLGVLSQFVVNGTTPFISNNSTEDVYITRYSQPNRVEENYYIMQIDLRKA